MKRSSNPNCEETHATFSIGGDMVVPDEITEILSLSPDLAIKRGDIRYGGVHPVKMRTGVWSLSSEGKLDSTDLEEHLLFLLESVSPKTNQITSIKNRFESEVKFRCYWMSATGYGGPVLTPPTLHEIANLGALLDFDLYFAG